MWPNRWLGREWRWSFRLRAAPTDTSQKLGPGGVLLEAHEIDVHNTCEQSVGLAFGYADRKELGHRRLRILGKRGSPLRRGVGGFQIRR
jgi:hypothetical protein